LTKRIDTVIGLILSIIALSIWIYRMILTSDIPIVITQQQFIIFMIIISFYTVIQFGYIIKTKRYILNIIYLAFPSIIWTLTLNDTLPQGYNKFDTISVVFGGGIVILAFLYCSYKALKKLFQ